MFDVVIPEVSPIQHECLTEAIYHEARGESYIGQLYVGFVIKNRVKSSKFPDTYCKVIDQPYQFSYNGMVDTTMYEHDARDFSSAVAEIIMTTPNPLPETVYYYHADWVLPSWDWSKLNEFQVVDRHIFYEELG